MQLVPEGAEEASAGSVRTPLLLLLLQQDREVSGVMEANELAGGVAFCEQSLLGTKPPSHFSQFNAPCSVSRGVLCTTTKTSYGI